MVGKAVPAAPAPQEPFGVAIPLEFVESARRDTLISSA